MFGQVIDWTDIKEIVTVVLSAYWTGHSSRLHDKQLLRVRCIRYCSLPCTSFVQDKLRRNPNRHSRKDLTIQAIANSKWKF
ncbi:hypothetical protein MKW98_001198 [Papaver atlanticum]|uniref:Uncharacterized protein n=1 Tax=Papaver atlanticum TaxID=357466 RepID=A0AAD4SUM3_9MAGN|nr:hypothetical protein MKW98_001198 [Papaver atlanticum]